MKVKIIKILFPTSNGYMCLVETFIGIEIICLDGNFVFSNIKEV